MCNIEPTMAEVNISDIVRHIIMSNETDDANEEDIRRLTFFLEQQEQNNLPPMQFATIMHVVRIDYVRSEQQHVSTSSCVANNAENQIDIQKGSGGQAYACSSAISIPSDALLASISPRAGPMLATL